MSVLAQDAIFVRLVDIPLAVCIDGLEKMGLREGSPVGVLVGRSKLRWVGRAQIQDGCELTVQLHRGALLPKLGMRLRLLAWSSTRGATQIELVPCRAVRAGGRYYAAGHELLDALIAKFGRETAAHCELSEAS
jgi:hypothetical protein